MTSGSDAVTTFIGKFFIMNYVHVIYQFNRDFTGECDCVCKNFINLSNHANNVEFVTKIMKNHNISFKSWVFYIIIYTLIFRVKFSTKLVYHIFIFIKEIFPDKSGHCSWPLCNRNYIVIFLVGCPIKIKQIPGCQLGI